MSLYQKKYRVESARLAGKDYTDGGKYFVTICTLNRACWFGKVDGIEMALSSAGRIVADEWQRTGKLRANVGLDAWQVMPNHFHGIVVLNHSPISETKADQNGRALQALKPNSLGSIIGQFKAACTRRIRAAGLPAFDWQPRFHDKIIRDDRSLDAIRQYIHDNPRKWAEDSDNPVNWIDIYAKERERRIGRSDKSEERLRSREETFQRNVSTARARYQ